MYDCQSVMRPYLMGVFLVSLVSIQIRMMFLGGCLCQIYQDRDHLKRKRSAARHLMIEPDIRIGSERSQFERYLWRATLGSNQETLFKSLQCIISATHRPTYTSCMRHRSVKHISELSTLITKERHLVLDLPHKFIQNSYHKSFRKAKSI